LAAGSCRSVPGLHIVELLRNYESLLDRFGGHSQAAGLSISSSRIDQLREALLADPKLLGLNLPVAPELWIDAQLDHQQVTLETARLVMQLSPYGAGNPEPVFMIPAVSIVRAELMGRDRSHLKMVWRGPHGEVRAPFFGAAERLSELSHGKPVDVACHLSVDQWNGQPRVDVKVLDFRPSA
ncbi:MAG: DHHA1 domain-containing protein, partial [Thermomicrobiales bacterium]